MKFGEGDVPVDIGVLPKGSGDGIEKERGQQSLLVVTTKGYGKRVNTDEFRLTRR